MTKLLVSDYDGTINVNDRNVLLNKSAISKFRKDGNYFAINTTRPYKYIVDEVERRHIEYDFLACGNGDILVDNKHNVISHNEFAMDAVTDLINYFNEANIDCMTLFMDYYGHSSNNLDEMKDISSIICVPFSINFQNIINRKLSFYELYQINSYFHFINIIKRKGINKASVISEMLDVLDNVNPSDVYSIGNYNDDLPMLNQYHGYRMSHSLCRTNLPKVNSVHELIKKINNK